MSETDLEKARMTQEQMMSLFNVFDNPRSSFFESSYKGGLSKWQPGTDVEKKAFAELIDPGNRQSLRDWYSRFHWINPAAEAFRKMLVEVVGEDLPVGRVDTTEATGKGLLW